VISILERLVCRSTLVAIDMIAECGMTLDGGGMRIRGVVNMTLARSKYSMPVQISRLSYVLKRVKLDNDLCTI
jgi:hypothetical protein